MKKKTAIISSAIFMSLSVILSIAIFTSESMAREERSPRTTSDLPGMDVGNNGVFRNPTFRESAPVVGELIVRGAEIAITRGYGAVLRSGIAHAPSNENISSGGGGGPVGPRFERRYLPQHNR